MTDRDGGSLLLALKAPRTRHGLCFRLCMRIISGNNLSQRDERFYRAHCQDAADLFSAAWRANA